MKKSNLYSTVLSVGLLTAVGSVQAMEITAEDVDLNADGMVTEAEILNVIKGNYIHKGA